MDVVDLYIFDNTGAITGAVTPIELQHTEQAYTLYARIPGDAAIGDGYAVGFKCIDDRFRIFDISDHTAMEPDGVIEINAIDQAVRELMDEPITDLRPQNITVTQAVTRLISGTRFIIGNVSCSNAGGMTAYYESVWDALVDAQTAFDCVLVPYFEITGGIITARKIDILARNGADRGRIFELGDDLADIRIKYDESQIKTALFGRGRGVELDGGDGDPTYGRRLTFADVAWSTSGGDPADKPNGQEWIGDPDALAAYSRDGRHRFGFVTFDSEEDAETLLQKTWDKLQELKQPRIIIECTVLDTERTMGRSHDAVRYGDGILVRITKRGIDIDAKVSGVVRDYIRPERTKLTIGNAAPSAGKIVADLQATLDNYSSRASVWDRSSAFDIDGAIDVMNNQILSTTGSWYTDKDTGAIMMVSTDGTKAMRLTGAGWQIASEKIGNAWVWRTAATGSGIVADQITTGVLNANLIRAGTLSDFIGANFWDLTTGEFRLSSTSTYIDDSQISIGDVITNVDVEYAQNQSTTIAPDSGWSTTAPAWREGYYIWQRTATTTSDGSTTYSTATCIQGADGADGTSVTVSSIQYGTSSSAGTQPSSWSTTVPSSITKGKWLWVKTTYSDGSIATTKSYVGTDGDDGKSVYIASASKSGGVTTVVLEDTDGQQTTLTIADGDDGDDGQPGAGGYVHTAWANSADGQTDFSTSVSTGKKYLGVYTDHTQADSQNYQDYSWSLIKGADGADGTSVTVSSIQYGTSSSAGTQPSSWSTTVPSSITKGKWLWVKTTYSDGSIATTKSYVGTDGDDGKSVYIASASKSGGVTTVVLEDTDGQQTTLTIADGDDGDDGQPGAGGYVHTAWANSADGQTDFSTSVSTGKKYLGVYTDHTQADSQNYQDYSWSLIKGADGADGTGITSIQEQYYLSTSSSTQTGGSWSTSQPVWESGKYIWTRSRITWDDGTTANTTPVLAAAINGANETAKAATDVQTQSGIFNLLTNNGQLQGIYMSDGNLYINASYIAAGTLSADRIGTSSLSLGKLATGSVFSTISDSGMRVTHGSASNAYTTLDASGLRMYNSGGNMIGGLYVPTGQSTVKMGASSLMNPSYPNFSIQLESQWSGSAMAYYYMLSFFRRNTFAFGLGVEDDDNFSGGFVMDKNGNSTSLDAIIDVSKTWSGVDPSELTATEVNYGTNQMHIWQESGQVYFKSPGDIFMIMNINGRTCTLRMSDVYDLLNP